MAPVGKLSVVIAMILAMLFLGEHLTWRHWIGAGISMGFAEALSDGGKPPAWHCMAQTVVELIRVPCV